MFWFKNNQMDITVQLQLVKSLLVSGLVVCAGCQKQQPSMPIISKGEWQYATRQTHNKYANEVANRLTPFFERAHIPYPPKELALLAFKKEQRIELWAKGNLGQWQYIKDYPLTAFSGTLGPKLSRNDGQIPEGIYKITQFNPYSSQHLSMMLNYPNQFDKHTGMLDGRSDLGDNIFIHGKAKSVGCLAVGNQAIDDLFVLVHEVGKNNTQVVIAPNDLRKQPPLTSKKNKPRWLPSLYSKIRQQLSHFKRSRLS
jgi:murein L,D-transpeptidase YafK